MQIVMCDKRDYGRGFGKGTPRGQIDHLLREISREALINGMRGSNGLAIAKNGCCRSCVASDLLSASTSI